MINTIKNELMLFINGYFKGEYPDYILKNKLTAEIPVFIYHHITSNEFEERLQYLKYNSYMTLTADQLAQALRSRASAPERSVAITFDDGLSDVYQIVFPLLKKYQLKVVVFLLPGWMGTPGVLTWDQVKEMHQSSLVDFQSHSMNHPAIFSTPELFDFYNPGHSNLKSWNIPLTQTENGNSVPPTWGSPIYQFSSRFSDEKRFYPNKTIQQICIDYVAKSGNENFFNRKNWRNELTAIIDNYKKNNACDESFETEKDQKAKISDELRLSKNKIEEKLPDKVVRHFAWPWNQVGILTAKLLVENGYTTSFMGLSTGHVNNDEIKDIPLIRRVTGDFIKCLPGKGRQSFWSVMFQKIIRRLKFGATY